MIGHEMLNYEVSQYLNGGQGQFSGPHVPPLGHGDKIESPMLSVGDHRTLNGKLIEQSTSVW